MFFCRSSRQDEKTYFATLFSASSRLVVYLIEADYHYDEFLCLFVCLFFFQKDVFRLVKSVGQDKYLQILRSDALQFRGIILW